MAKFTLQFTPYTRRDPVTGVRRQYIRGAHSIQSSKTLKEFQACVAKGMRGYKPSGATPEDRARNLRNHFSEVAARCK